MKIVIAGGRGLIGKILVRGWQDSGHDIVLLTREKSATRTEPNHPTIIYWDGKTLGSWVSELEGADIIINLAGRTVDCRYHAKHLKQMMDSRVISTRLIGRALNEVSHPPALWLQASTATIYAHRFDAANDDTNGLIGGDEENTPKKWIESIKIAQAWEKALLEDSHPHTRKVALRTSLVMSSDKGGVFDILSKLCRLGMGYHGNGKQYVSWIHERDFVSAINFIIESDSLAGPLNLAAPNPLPNRDFIHAIHQATNVKLSMPVPQWLLEIGAFFMRTESELLLKSRRVISSRLIDSGFKFNFPSWPEAARDLVKKKS